MVLFEKMKLIGMFYCHVWFPEGISKVRRNERCQPPRIEMGIQHYPYCGVIGVSWVATFIISTYFNPASAQGLPAVLPALGRARSCRGTPRGGRRRRGAAAPCGRRCRCGAGDRLAVQGGGHSQGHGARQAAADGVTGALGKALVERKNFPQFCVKCFIYFFLDSSRIQLLGLPRIKVLGLPIMVLGLG